MGSRKRQKRRAKALEGWQSYEQKNWGSVCRTPSCLEAEEAGVVCMQQVMQMSSCACVGEAKDKEVDRGVGVRVRVRVRVQVEMCNARGVSVGTRSGDGGDGAG